MVLSRIVAIISRSASTDTLAPIFKHELHGGHART